MEDDHLWPAQRWGLIGENRRLYKGMALGLVGSPHEQIGFATHGHTQRKILYWERKTPQKAQENKTVFRAHWAECVAWALAVWGDNIACTRRLEPEPSSEHKALWLWTQYPCWKSPGLFLLLGLIFIFGLWRFSAVVCFGPPAHRVYSWEPSVLGSGFHH